MLTLTRYLYPKEFVVLSFYNSMTSKKELKECLFWIYELYYSGFVNDTFDAIYNCYFDFYALLNPSIIDFINKKVDLWKKKKDDSIIGLLVKHLYSKKSNNDMFLLNLSMSKITKKQIKKGPKPKWLKPYEPFQNQIRDIHSKNDEAVLFDINTMKSSDYQKFLDVLIKYFKNETKTDISSYPYLCSEIDETHYFSKKYILFVIKFLRDYKATNPSKMVIALNPFEISFIIEFKEFTGPLYRVLKTKRTYPIHSTFIKTYCSSSLLTSDILNETRNHWKIHCKDTPFWYEKFNSSCQDDLEFDFEFDEQSLECQQKSCLL